MPIKKYFSKLAERFRALRNPEILHHELTAEFQFHIDARAEQLQAQGMPAEEARRTAARQFGPALRVHEQSFDARGGGSMEEIWNDVRFAFRMLRKSPARTALLILTLALGIGANTGVFSVINSVLLRELPFAEPSRLVLLHQADHGQVGGVSYPHYLDWRARSQSFSDMAVYNATSLIFVREGETARLYGATVSSSLFSVLGIAPLRGRLFRSEEDRWGGVGDGQPVLISDRLWRSRFQGKEDVIGQPLVLDGKPHRVIGVLPARLAFPVQNDPLDYWLPVGTDADPAYYGGTVPTSRGYPRYDAVVARLKPGVTPEQARAEMNLLATNMAREHPMATSMNQVAVVPALEDVVGGSRPMLMLVYGGVFCTLLVACANAATLLLAGAGARQKEFAVRAALGAKGARIIRQLVIESLIVSFASGVAGALVAWFMVILFGQLAPANTPRLSDVHLDARVLLYALGISALTGIGFGIFPAIAATRINIVACLKDTARSIGGRSGALYRSTLLISGQIAISMALTCCAALLATSFVRILQSPKGFDPQNILAAAVSLPPANYPRQSPRTAQFFERLLAELRTLPGVESASAAQTLPLSGQNNSTSIEIVGAPLAGKPGADLRFVDVSYFQTLRITLTAGRQFNAQDTAGSAPALIVNQAFVRRYLKTSNPLGTRVHLGWGGNVPKQIVGVIADIRHNSLAIQSEPEVYVPQAQFPSNDMSILLRTTGDPLRLAPALRQKVAAMDASVPVEQVRTLEGYLLLSIAPQRFVMWVLLLFAGGTLLLAAIGLYGIVSYSVRVRTFEFGIRMALGSTARGLMGLVLRQGLAIASPGIVAGLALAIASTRWLARWLYDTSPTDTISLAGSAGVLLLISLAACLGPARRAASVSPWSSMRAD